MKTNIQKYMSKNTLCLKYNFCDGGVKDEYPWFNWVCSEKNIMLNMGIVKGGWCSSDGSDGYDSCACYDFSQGNLTYQQLEDILNSGGSICCESRLLHDWEVLINGTVGTGKGRTIKKPRPLPKDVRENTLCVLTTLEPGCDELERIIFAVFLVENSWNRYERQHEGILSAGVTAHPILRIYLMPEEARKILFWEYFKNPKAKESTQWTTNYRRMEDKNAAVLLFDIMESKKDTVDEENARRLFEVFCETNDTDGFDEEKPSAPTGYLSRHPEILVNIHKKYFSLYDDVNYKLESVVYIDGEEEGKKTQYYTTKYERSQKNRNAAIRIHGLSCYVCKFNFENIYDKLGKNFIEVHHIKPLFDRDEVVVINPKKDLICICSNCHRMLHRKRDSIITPDELKNILFNNQTKT